MWLGFGSIPWLQGKKLVLNKLFVLFYFDLYSDIGADSPVICYLEWNLLGKDWHVASAWPLTFREDAGLWSLMVKHSLCGSGCGDSDWLEHKNSEGRFEFEWQAAATTADDVECREPIRFSGQLTSVWKLDTSLMMFVRAIFS